MHKGFFTNYTQLQKKPVSHFYGNYGKIIKNQTIFYTIFFNNQLCIKLFDNVTVLLKPVHAVRQCRDNASFLKVTSFRQLVFTKVLVLISSLRPITGMPLSAEAIKCVQKPKHTA